MATPLSVKLTKIRKIKVVSVFAVGLYSILHQAYDRICKSPDNTPTGKTMLIELDSDNRASLRRLFDRYPCLHGSVAAVIEGGMGRVFADAQEEPCVALAVLDFHFLAGDPLHPNALLLFKLLQPGDVVIAPTPAWQHLVAATYPSALAVYRREAFQAEQFDIDQLRRFCQALPIGFELRQVGLEE